MNAWNVRKKLIALVLVCVAPAVLGAILQSNASRRQVLEQVERRVDAANRRFESELDEYQRNSRLALTLADLTPNRVPRRRIEGTAQVA